MKTRNLICFLTLCVASFASLNACNNQNGKCDNIACTAAIPPIGFQLVDAQNRDLLDPAIPGHYDTAAIKKLNDRKINVVPSKAMGNNDKTLLLLNGGYQNETVIYNLSATDQDTVFYNDKATFENCCATFHLTDFKYNGKTVMQSTINERIYTVIK